MNKQQAQQFLSILDQLSVEVRYYFQNEISSRNIQMLAEQYSLDKDVIDDLLITTVISGFDYEQLIQGVNQLSTDSRVAQELLIDFLGMVLLPIDEYLDLDIASAVVGLGGNLELYHQYVIDLKHELENHALELLDKYIEETEENIDIEAEKEIVFDLFTNNLLEILQDDDVEALVALNSGLIYVLNNDEGSVRKLENILLENQTRISKDAIIVNDRSVEPNVANWLHHFISEVGAGKFDSLVMADYMVRSNNAKNLSDFEKQTLHRLLELYYNLKFYPDSMAGKSLIDWLVIPISVDNSVEPALGNGRMSLEPRTAEAVNSQVLKLQKMAEKYAENSLERMAIEEEIKKHQ